MSSIFQRLAVALADHRRPQTRGRPRRAARRATVGPAVMVMWSSSSGPTGPRDAASVPAAATVARRAGSGWDDLSRRPPRGRPRRGRPHAGWSARRPSVDRHHGRGHPAPDRPVVEDESSAAPTDATQLGGVRASGSPLRLAELTASGPSRRASVARHGVVGQPDTERGAATGHGLRQRRARAAGAARASAPGQKRAARRRAASGDDHAGARPGRGRRSAARCPCRAAVPWPRRAPRAAPSPRQHRQAVDGLGRQAHDQPPAMARRPRLPSASGSPAPGRVGSCTARSARDLGDARQAGQVGVDGRRSSRACRPPPRVIRSAWSAPISSSATPPGSRHVGQPAKEATHEVQAVGPAVEREHRLRSHLDRQRRARRPLGM